MFSVQCLAKRNAPKCKIVCEINKIDLKEETFLPFFLSAYDVFCNFVPNYRTTI